MSIPNHAKPVFTGNQFTVYQWEETLFDGSKTVFEYAQKLDSVKAIVVTEQNTVLVTKEEQPGGKTGIYLPGGVVEYGEERILAIKREITEETGYEPVSLDPYIDSVPAEYRLYCHRETFIARGCKKVTEPRLDAGEKIEVLEMSVDEFMEAVLDGEIRARDLQREFLIEYRKDPSLAGLRKKILGME